MPSLNFEGGPVPIEPGDTIASALYRAGVRVFSRSFKYHRPRGLYCLTGDCPNCLVTVDGEPCVRACATPAADGQRVRRENAWPSADGDALAVLWRLRWLLPVGFYYKSLLRPAFAWRLAEPLVRRIAGIGSVSLELEPAHRELRHHHADVLVAGGGPAGGAAALERARAGERVVLADEGELDDQVAEELRASDVTVLERAAVVGIYEGPLVPIDCEDRLHLVHCARAVVATGAVERHPVFPGNDLVGVWLGRGAARLASRHGLRAGKSLVFAGSKEESLEHLEALLAAGTEIAACCLPPELASGAPGRLRVLEGAEIVAVRGRKRVRAAVVSTGGRRETIRCDGVVLSLDLVPRDGLLRQAGGLQVTAAGDAALSHAVLPEPLEGFVCPCEDVEVRDLERAWREGFRSAELLKRYTTATMGPCQGALCQPSLRAFVAARAGVPVAATTARPPARPIRLEDAAAGIHFAIEQRTGLHERHLELGARMEWAGAWKRPETYGEPLAEYWAVRRDVSVMDVGTLGKFLVAGPDATSFLERVYPCRVADLEPGRLRYALLLNEAGYVFDDGTLGALADGAYYLTFTSGAAEGVEAWLRDWADAWGAAVRIVNRTAAVGAINVVGPRSRELLSRLSASPLDNASLPYMHHRELDVAGVRCRALRLGFAGELGYELHHARSDGVLLWDALLEAGADLGVRPHGLEALRLLRLEKAHIIVGQDTDFDSTPAKLGLGWAVRPDGGDFVGRSALGRADRLPLELRLARLTFPDGAPPEGAPLSTDGRHAGHLTSSRFSPILGHGVALGWIRGDEDALPEQLEAGGSRGRVVSEAFYDPRGERLHA